MPETSNINVFIGFAPVLIPPFPNKLCEMSGTQSATLTPWPGLPEDPAAQREWAKRWQKDLPKGGLNEEQRALVVNWAIANIELFRSSSQLLWEGEMRIFINIAT